MTPRPEGLRRRLAIAISLMALSAVALAESVLWIADFYMEDYAVRGMLRAQMSALVNPPGPDHTQRGAIVFFRPARDTQPPLPNALKTLGPGFHHDVEWNRRTYHVLVRDVAPGDRAWIAYDVSHVEQHGLWLSLILAALLLAIVAAVPTLSSLLARRTLAPLDRLVDQLHRLNPEKRGQHVSVDDPKSEMAVIAEALNQYMTALDALVERERAFASAASHELRTPLAVIQGAVETLELDARVPPAPLARAQRAVREARQDLDALLALSRLNESPPAERLDLTRLLPQLAESDTSAPARLVWDREPGVGLTAPPGAVSIVFSNLLRNALRAAGTGEVRVTLRPGSVRIADSGAGIADHELAHVFEPRFRGTDGGSGMGLYIARALALRYGWKLSLANRPGGGAEAHWEFAAN